MKKKATTSRRTARPGASKAPKRRRKASVKGAAASPATITIAGIGRYKKSTCHKTKSDAQKSAEGKRAKGQKARVLKSGTGYCVYARGRAK